jgi:hypothetical protein
MRLKSLEQVLAVIKIRQAFLHTYSPLPHVKFVSYSPSKEASDCDDEAEPGAPSTSSTPSR